jgi:hypothetical protein
VNRHRAFGAAATLVVFAGIILGFRSLGGPAKQREIGLDERRSADLSLLSGAINRRYRVEKKLFSDLGTVRMWDPGLHTEDPLTHTPYEYRVLGETEYQLCATFAREGAAAGIAPGQNRRFAFHPPGRYSFGLDTRASVY